MTKEAQSAHVQTEEEKSRRLLGVARDIREKAESIHGDFNTFFKNRDEIAHRYFPKVEELEALTGEDREQVLRLIGRMSASMRILDDWSKPFVRECDAVVENATEREKVEEIIGAPPRTLRLSHGVRNEFK